MPVAPTLSQKAVELVADGAPDELSLAWVKPLDTRAETLAVDRERMRRQLAAAILNNRLSDRALQPGSPFAGAGANVDDDLLGTAALVSLGISADPAKWQPALDAVLEEQRMLLRDGVTADELKRATTSMLARFQAIADGATTRRDESLADGIADIALEDDLYTSPAQDSGDDPRFLRERDARQRDGGAARSVRGRAAARLPLGPAPGRRRRLPCRRRWPRQRRAPCPPRRPRRR